MGALACERLAMPTGRSMGIPVWRHDAILTFVNRLTRDQEFREWFAESPSEALASYGLKESDLRYLARALRWETAQREVAGALLPFVEMLIEAAEGHAQEADIAYARLTSKIDELKGQIPEAQARDRSARPWWKFWLWL